MVYCFIEHLGIKASLVDDGDDCVLFTESKFTSRVLEGIEGFFQPLGFKLTVEEPVYVLEHVVFCQSQPVWDGQQYIMVRDPRTALAKDCVSLKPLTDVKTTTKWLSAVSKGGLSLTGRIPVWQNFYRLLLKESRGAKPLTDPTLETGLVMLAKGMKREFGVCSSQTRMSFFQAFNITPDEQEAIENYYDTSNFTAEQAESCWKQVMLPL
jgi:hypothetical protein